MKTLLKISAVCLLLVMAVPSFAQVSWGVDLRFGTPPPPPREVIVERPYPDAVWEPGYYNYGPDYRYAWVPGRWHPHYWVPQGHRYGWYGRRDWDDRGRDNRQWDRHEQGHSRDDHRSQGR